MAAAQALRADARRNRDQIVAAAKTVFAERGADVPMEEIARRSNVGIGTLYRRFPDRDTLIQEVAQDSFAVLLAHSREAESSGGFRWEGFLGILDLPELWFALRLTRFSPDTWPTVYGDPRTRATAEDLVTVLDGLVRNAQASGSIRSDVGTGDVLFLVALVVVGVRASAGTLDRSRYERVLALGLDALRPGTTTPLPGTPLAPEDLRPRCSRS